MHLQQCIYNIDRTVWQRIQAGKMFLRVNLCFALLLNNVFDIKSENTILWVCSNALLEWNIHCTSLEGRFLKIVW